MILPAVLTTILKQPRLFSIVAPQSVNRFRTPTEDKKYCSSCAKRVSSFEMIGCIKNAILSRKLLTISIAFFHFVGMILTSLDGHGVQTAKLKNCTL